MKQKEVSKSWSIRKEGRMVLAMVCEFYEVWRPWLELPQEDPEVIGATAYRLANRNDYTYMREYFTVAGWDRAFWSSRSKYNKLYQSCGLDVLLQKLTKKGYFIKAKIPGRKKECYYFPNIKTFSRMNSRYNYYRKYIEFENMNQRNDQTWAVDFELPLPEADKFCFSWEENLEQLEEERIARIKAKAKEQYLEYKRQQQYGAKEVKEQSCGQCWIDAIKRLEGQQYRREVSCGPCRSATMLHGSYSNAPKQDNLDHELQQIIQGFVSQIRKHFEKQYVKVGVVGDESIYKVRR